MKSDKCSTALGSIPSKKSVRELEEELRRLKQKEKTYLQLAKKMQQLQQKSKTMKRDSQALKDENAQHDQIQYLKSQIQKTITDNKKLDEDNKVIKGQTKSLQNQLKILEQAFNSISGENRLHRQRIQIKDEQLVEKQNQLQGLVQKKHCNEIVIEELRGDLGKLQGEEEDLRRQLQKMRMQRIQEQRNRQKLRDTVEQLKRELLQQEQNGQDLNYRLSQVKEGNTIIKQELMTMIELEQRLKDQLHKAVKKYQNTVAVEMQATHKLKLLEDQLQVVEADVRMLTDEYIKESGHLRQQQLQNQSLNSQMDLIAKEIFEVWGSVKELIDLNPDSHDEVKIRCYQTWAQIAKILDIQ